MWTERVAFCRKYVSGGGDQYGNLWTYFHGWWGSSNYHSNMSIVGADNAPNANDSRLSPPLSSTSTLNGTKISLPPNLMPIFNQQDSDCYYWQPSTGHTNLQVAMCDGGVRNISSSIGQDTFNLAFAPNEGASLPSDW